MKKFDFKRSLAVLLTMTIILAVPMFAGASIKTDLYFAAGDGLVWELSVGQKTAGAGFDTISCGSKFRRCGGSTAEAAG